MEKNILEKKKKGYGRAFFLLLIATSILNRGDELIINGGGGLRPSEANLLMTLEFLVFIATIYSVFMWFRIRNKIKHLND